MVTKVPKHEHEKIRDMYIRGYSDVYIANKYGCTRQNIRKIITAKPKRKRRGI